MNKKGLVASVLIFLAVFMAVSFTVIKIINLFGPFDKNIGELQTEIIKQNYLLEKDAFFMEQAAKNALLESIPEMASNGGLFEKKCGEFLGHYALWQSDTEQCMPDQFEIKENLLLYLKKNFNAIIKDTSYSDHQDGFEFYIGSQLYGSALKPISSNFAKNSEISMLPSFTVFNLPSSFSYSYFIRVFEEKNILYQLVDCENKGSSIYECANQLITELNKENNFKWKIDCDRITDENTINAGRILPLCVTDTSEESLYYINSQIKKSNPVLKFALYIKDLPPKEVENVKLYPKQGEDKSVIISWEKSEESDVEKYNIYFSDEFNLKDKKIENSEIEYDSKKAEKIKLDIASLSSKGKYQKVTYILPECKFSSITGKCMHNVVPFYPDGTFPSGYRNMMDELEKEILYLGSDNMYFYLLPALNDNEYSFAVTGVDKSGNEVEETTKSFEITPEDKLAPGKVSFTAGYDPISKKINVRITPPLENVGGSTFSGDIQKYMIFIGKDEDNIVSIDDYDKEIALGEADYVTSKNIDADTYVGVIAVDKSNNPLIKKQATADEEAKLEINNEYINIIDEIANPQKITIS